MNSYTISFALFFAHYQGAPTISAFAPNNASHNSKSARITTSSTTKKGTELHYLREAGTNGLSSLTIGEGATRKRVAFDTVTDEEKDPMEDAFDNMQHPMELMLLNRACIPYVAENRISEVKKILENQRRKDAKQLISDDFKEDDFVDPMEDAFDNMQHPMELMLLNRACIPYVAENKKFMETQRTKNVNKKIVDTSTQRIKNAKQEISEDCNKDDFVDPMEDAFDNMQHPMELVLLNRACIPYVAENRIAERKTIVENQRTKDVRQEMPDNHNEDDFVDPMEDVFDTMQHPIELMLLTRACIPYVAKS